MGKLQSIGEEIQTPELITHMEAHVFATLNGRVLLPSPLHWADAVVTRLKALVAISMQNSEFALANVQTWGFFVIEKINATTSLPPRTLGFTACTLGLISAGILPLREIQALNLPALFLQTALQAQDRFVGDDWMELATTHPMLQVEQLAKAACCSTAEFCDLISAGGTTLQACLMGN